MRLVVGQCDQQRVQRRDAADDAVSPGPSALDVLYLGRHPDAVPHCPRNAVRGNTTRTALIKGKGIQIGVRDRVSADGGTAKESIDRREGDKANTGAVQGNSMQCARSADLSPCDIGELRISHRGQRLFAIDTGQMPDAGQLDAPRVLCCCDRIPYPAGIAHVRDLEANRGTSCDIA
ncbi:Uncharacterised protein [Mycobacteroides abscessus subsp. abscessus]|nr:Uncharacterised protein [Mycobacteroides abscessus subsp. abscessus]